MTKKAPETEAPKRPCPEGSDDPHPQRVQRCHRVALPRTAAVCQGRAMVCQLRFVPVDCAGTEMGGNLLICLWKFADSDNESRYIKVINSNFCLFRNGGFTRESPFNSMWKRLLMTPLDVWEPRVHKLTSLMNWRGYHQNSAIHYRNWTHPFFRGFPMKSWVRIVEDLIPDDISPFVSELPG